MPMIRGRVLTVMESWPLQLSITTAGGTEFVTLDESTQVEVEGAGQDVGALRPGLQVRITTSESEPTVARRVEIMSTRPQP